MKRLVALRFGLVAVAATAAVLAFVIVSQEEPTTRDKMGAAVKSDAGASPLRTTTAKMDDSTAAARSPSPEFDRDYKRLRTAWIQRTGRMEMSRFELASLAQEVAGMEMGLSEAKRAELRQILNDYRNAILLHVEYPRDAEALTAPTGANPLERIEKRLDLPTSPGNVYGERMREALGEERLIEFEHLERQERSKLILERQVFRKIAKEPGRGD